MIRLELLDPDLPALIVSQAREVLRRCGVEVHASLFSSRRVAPEPRPSLADGGVHICRHEQAIGAVSLARGKPRLLHAGRPVQDRSVHIEEDGMRVRCQ